MERLVHATRSKGVANGQDPVWKSGKAPAAVRKLQSKEEWNFKPSGCTLPGFSSASSSDDSDTTADSDNEEEDEEDVSPFANDQKSFRFIGETKGVADLFAEAAVCG